MNNFYNCQKSSIFAHKLLKSTTHELLKNRFANYDPKTSFHKLGRALSDQSFDFETDRKTTGHVYRLVER